MRVNLKKQELVKTNKLAVGLFASDCTDARVRKRVKAFQTQGWEVIGFTFRKSRYNQNYIPEWENVNLGCVQDRAYWKRICAMLYSLVRLIRFWRRIRALHVLYAINLDSMLLSLAASLIGNKRQKIVYEVGDIQKPFVQRTTRGAIIRFVERFVLHHSNLLVVTSPAFIDNYFQPLQQYTGLWFLLENKLYPPVPEPLDRVTDKTECKWREKRWKVGYFGALRCKKSWEIIKKLVKTSSVVDFYLRGVPTLIQHEEFVNTLLTEQRITYGGEYNLPADLPKMYAAVDFAWCFELVDEKHNSNWLLPNRLYEASYYGVPLLAPKHFEVGDYIEKLGIGWTFSPPYEEEISHFFNTLHVEEYETVRKKCLDLDHRYFMSDDQFHELAILLGTLDDGFS